MVVLLRRRHRHGDLRGSRANANPALAAGRLSMGGWPALSYADWSATCDTLHAHTQVLGKLSFELTPPEPQLKHAALRLSVRGWETHPLPARDGSGAIVAALDLPRHEAV